MSEQQVSNTTPITTTVAEVPASKELVPGVSTEMVPLSAAPPEKQPTVGAPVMTGFGLRAALPAPATGWG